MYDQFQKQSAAFGKQFVEHAYNVQMATLKGVSEIHGAQVKALESQAKSNLAFLSDVMEAHDFKDASALWPKGLDFARGSAEAAYATHQEIMGIAQKTAEQFGDVARDGMKTANDAVSAAAKEPQTSRKAR